MTARLIYNRKYRDEVWSPLAPRPDAVSTTRYDEVARLLRGRTGRILDVGCGAGQLLVALAGQFDDLYGIDVADERIARGQRAIEEHCPQLRSRIHLLAGRCDEQLPFEDAAFDVVTACVVLEFVADIFCAMDEIARVVRPGGYLVASVANICYIRHVLSLMQGRVPLTSVGTRDMATWRMQGWDGGCLRYFSKQTLSDLLQHTGFVPEQWSGSGKFARLRRWCRRLCGDLVVRARRR